MKKNLLLIISIFLVSLFINSDRVTAEKFDYSHFVFLPIVINNYDGSVDWLDFQLVSMTPTPLNNPEILVDTSANIHIVWDTWSSSNQFIYHRFFNKTEWSESKPIAFTLGISKLLYAPVAGFNNDIHLLWKNDLALGGPYRLMYAKWDGNTWQPEVEMLRNNSYSQIQGMVKPGLNGDIHALLMYSDYLTSYLQYQRYSSGEWTTLQSVTKPEFMQRVWPDNSGGVVFVGDDFQNQGRFSYWKNGFLTVKDLVVGDEFNYRPGIVDGSLDVHMVKSTSVAIPGGYVTGLTHQCLDKNRIWLPPEVISGENAIAYSAFASSEVGNLITVWKGSGDVIHINFWRDCQMVKEIEKDLNSLAIGYDWADLESISWNENAQKACVLLRKSFSSSDFGVFCVKTNF